MFKNTLRYIGKISNFIFPLIIIKKIINLLTFIHSGRIGFLFKKIGKNPIIKYPCYTLGSKNIIIGNNFFASNRLRIEAWEKHENANFNPKIEIGDNVTIADNCHITSINSIKINNNVLIGSNVLITDHNHGKLNINNLFINPNKRILFSKGEIIIEENVWIGNSAVILPNVTIGKYSIVAANSVVTKSFPPKSLIGGVPASLIKTIK